MVHARKRLALPPPLADWLRRAASPAVVTVLPIDVPVIVVIDSLPRRFQGDPADRLIVATARTHRLALATRDLRIRASRTVSLWKP